MYTCITGIDIYIYIYYIFTYAYIHMNFDDSISKSNNSSAKYITNTLSKKIEFQKLASILNTKLTL